MSIKHKTLISPVRLYPMVMSLIVSFLLLYSGCGIVDSGEEEVLRVLFVGNSLTYTNDLPAVVEALAEAATESGVDRRLEYEVVAFPNFSLEDHWNEGTAREALSDGNWDVLVLQQGPSSLPENKALLRTWAKRFADEARSHGTEVALFTVWPSSQRSFAFPAVIESYKAAAEAVDGLLLPAGAAWRAAWDRDASLALYGPDDFHPSELGTYLAVLVIYSGLFDTSPQGLPSSLQLRDGSTIQVPNQIVRPLQDAAEEAPQPPTSSVSITQIVGPDGDNGGNTLRAPWTIATDAIGNAFIAGWFSDNAFKIGPSGTITRIIGPSGDGVGHPLRHPTWMSTDASDNVYVAGESSDNVFRITHGGTITQIIGPDGNGAGDSLDGAFGVASDDSGNIFVTGRYSDNVFRITPGGEITKILDHNGAGSGGGAGDGTGAVLDGPWGVATDATGNVFVTGWRSKNVFKITPGGHITEIIDATGDGSGNELTIPRGIATDPFGNVFVSGFASHNVFKITPEGLVTQIIDQAGDGLGHTLNGPNGVDTDSFGNVYVAGWLSLNAFRITPSGDIIQIIDRAGNGKGNTLNSPTGVATDASGSVFVVGEFSHNAFRITSKN